MEGCPVQKPQAQKKEGPEASPARQIRELYCKTYRCYWDTAQVLLRHSTYQHIAAAAAERYRAAIIFIVAACIPMQVEPDAK